jgi:hypothetical protein
MGHVSPSVWSCRLANCFSLFFADARAAQTGWSTPTKCLPINVVWHTDVPFWGFTNIAASMGSHPHKPPILGRNRIGIFQLECLHILSEKSYQFAASCVRTYNTLEVTLLKPRKSLWEIATVRLWFMICVRFSEGSIFRKFDNPKAVTHLGLGLWFRLRLWCRLGLSRISEYWTFGFSNRRSIEPESVGISFVRLSVNECHLIRKSTAKTLPRRLRSVQRSAISKYAIHAGLIMRQIYRRNGALPIVSSHGSVISWTCNGERSQ